MESHVRANDGTTTMVMTAEEFLTHPVPDGKAELVRGELRVTPPPGAPHAMAARNLVHLLDAHTSQRELGTVFPDGTSYELLRLPHTVRVPDVSFVRAGRLPVEGVGPGPLRMAPDLAVEVLSPSETASELEEKLSEYAIAGIQLVWVVDPVRRTVRVLAADAPVRWLREGETLDGGTVVPGFSCAVVEIFDGIARGG
jgi:Uma2 family endonuclease